MPCLNYQQSLATKLVVTWGYNHGCQNPDPDPTILQFYDSTCPKQSGSFKDLCDYSGLVRLYDSDDPKRS